MLCKDSKDKSCEGFAGLAIIVDIPVAELTVVPDSFAGASRQEGRGFDPGAGQKILRSPCDGTIRLRSSYMGLSENGVPQGRRQKPMVEIVIHIPINFPLISHYSSYLGVSTPFSDTPT
jgi:hypothetical protein